MKLTFLWEYLNFFKGDKSFLLIRNSNVAEPFCIIEFNDTQKIHFIFLSGDNFPVSCRGICSSGYRFFVRTPHSNIWQSVTYKICNLYRNRYEFLTHIISNCLNSNIMYHNGYMFPVRCTVIWSSRYHLFVRTPHSNTW